MSVTLEEVLNEALMDEYKARDTWLSSVAVAVTWLTAR